MRPLTPSALAASCREVADRCESENPPKLGAGRLFSSEGNPCCAGGHVLDPYRPDCGSFGMGIARAAGFESINFLPGGIYDEAIEVQYVNDRTHDAARPRAVAGPLRHLASVADRYADDWTLKGEA